MKNQNSIFIYRNRRTFSSLLLRVVTFSVLICCWGSFALAQGNTSSSTQQPEDFELFKLLREAHCVVCVSHSQPNYVTVVPVPEHVPGGPTQDPIIKFNEGCVLVDASDCRQGETINNISFLTFNYNNNEWDLWDEAGGSSYKPIVIPVPSGGTSPCYDGNHVMLSRYGSKVIIPTPNSIIVLRHDPQSGKVIPYDTVSVVQGGTIDPMWTSTNNGNTIIYDLVGGKDNEYQKVISDGGHRMVKDNMLYNWTSNGWDGGHQLNYNPYDKDSIYEKVVCVDNNLRQTVAIEKCNDVIEGYDYFYTVGVINNDGNVDSNQGSEFDFGHSDTWLIDNERNLKHFYYNQPSRYVYPVPPFDIWPDGGLGMPPYFLQYPKIGKATVNLDDCKSINGARSNDFVHLNNQIYSGSNNKSYSSYSDRRLVSIDRCFESDTYDSYQQGDEVTLKCNQDSCYIHKYIV